VPGSYGAVAAQVGFAAVLVRLIVNPIASSVTRRAREPVVAALASEHELEVVETTERGDAIRLARDAASQRIDVVAVLGGDGTLNEAACGLAGSSTALAALPGGSTNVFARTLGADHDPVAACDQLLRALAARAFKRVGLGVATTSSGDDRPFLFHLGVGFDASVVEQMELRSYLKRYIAHPAFAIAAVDTWLRHFDRATRICVAAGEEVVGIGPYAVVSNSDPYTYVLRRRLTVAPQAGLDRALAVTVFANLRPWLLVRAACSGLAGARFLSKSPDIAQRADLDRLLVTGDRPFAWQVDGDHLGHLEHLAVRYDADALTLVMP
jgi:diacylglycerol kinase family enzyme